MSKGPTELDWSLHRLSQGNDFANWRAFVERQLETAMDRLKRSTDHHEIARAQGAIQVLEEQVKIMDKRRFSMDQPKPRKIP